MDRRDFIKLSTTTGLGLSLGGICCRKPETTKPAAASQQTEKALDESAELYARYVPSDKKLDPQWVRSLTERGHPLDAAIVCSSKATDLSVVGMPVGGIACGTVYLSGDGQLWIFDIFNQAHEGVVPNPNTKAPSGLTGLHGTRKIRERDGANFVSPPHAAQHKNGVVQRFTLHDGSQARALDASGWDEVKFKGRWPLAEVEYSAKASPVKVTLTAYSPFVPLNLKDSSLPVTVLEYTVHNPAKTQRAVSLTGVLENALGQFSGLERLRRSQGVREPALCAVHHSLEAPKDTGPRRADRTLFDFERGGYEGWKVEGNAFGKEPMSANAAPKYQGSVGQQGERFVSSHASAVGTNAKERDAARGKLTSPEFAVDRKYLSCLVGGGNRQPSTAVNVVIAGKVVASIAGHNANDMLPAKIDLSAHQGARAQIQIVDDATGGWGNVAADHFVLTDTAPAVNEQLDSGSMCLAYLGRERATTNDPSTEVKVSANVPAEGSHTFRFVLGWYLPNLHAVHKQGERKRHYAAAYNSALAVVRHVASQQERLSQLTKTWVSTWNDSSLPQWLLDRTILPVNTLQTQNCLMFEDGRFWAWEGVGCCPGTCGHVWQYAQGHGRLFPEIERNLRERTDFAVAQQADGSIHFRGSNNRMAAFDAQTAYVLRTLRDHQLTDDPAYLGRVWPAAKKALTFLIDFDAKDKRGGLDGLLDGRQHNTLDAEWYGKVHVLCSMYLAALRAGEELAKDTGDSAFAERCRTTYRKGKENISKLFNGEYYEQEEDPAHADAIGVSSGCYIDQVMGQFWANQVGLGRLYNAEHQQSALRSLWKYNFVPDYGAFRKGFGQGRFYAGAGDSGLLMCTWPKGGLRPGFKKHWQYGYFNEFMTGFEYEVAAHMVAERDPELVQKGLAITRAIHDRYSSERGRNPYNEIECSDHYSRAGSSYAVFLAICGFHFDQSKGLLAFAPVIQADRFKVPFTTSEAWGTYEQEPGKASLSVTHGRLILNQLKLGLFAGKSPQASLNGAAVTIKDLRLKAGDVLVLS